MKTRSENRLLITLFIVLATLFLNSCHEKGCTDRNAINFNVVADMDDGSCIVCKGTQIESGSNTADLVDNNFSSPHFNQVVARVFVRQIKDSYNNSACGNTNQCRLYFRIQNLVSQQINLPYSVQCSSGNIFFSFFQFETITGLDTTEESEVPSTVSNPCGLLNGAFMSFNSNGTITYQ